MNKGFILPIALVVLVCGVVFVTAGELRWANGYFGISESQTEEKEIPIYKGWNLIQGFADPNFIVNNALDPSHIKAIFAFNPIDKKYYRVYPNPDRESMDKLPPIALQLPFWVYSDSGILIKANNPNSNGKIRYRTEKLEYNSKIEWPAGWNFISVSEEMIGKRLEDIKGNCNIEKAYIWNSESSSQEWQPWTDSIFTHSELVGYGFIVKFSNKCTLNLLGKSDQQINSPPQIPTDNSNSCIDSDGGLVIDVKGSITHDGEVSEDYCKDDYTLGERHCKNGMKETSFYDCVGSGFSRCENGRCI